MAETPAPSPHITDDDLMGLKAKLDRKLARIDRFKEMTGEWLREASILVAVFGILDKLLRREDPLTVTWTVCVLAVALTFFAIGVTIEMRRS